MKVDWKDIEIALRREYRCTYTKQKSDLFLIFVYAMHLSERQELKL